jgi:hypothetical protein
MRKPALLLLSLLLPGRILAAEEQKFTWDESWPKFSTAEYVVTGLAAAGSIGEFFLVPPPKVAVWKGPILFDTDARDAMLIPSAQGRKRANLISEVLTYPLIGYAALDAPLTAGWAGGNKDAALQLALINTETFAVDEILTLSVANALPRKRPPNAECEGDPHCVKSFWSGHEANVFAAASLLCAEHGAMDLYGGDADALVCGTALAAASAIGALRIAADDHYASDVIAGAAVGGATGYLMPKLLHFKFKRSAKKYGVLLPQLGPHGGGLIYVKAW